LRPSQNPKMFLMDGSKDETVVNEIQGEGIGVPFCKCILSEGVQVNDAELEDGGFTKPVQKLVRDIEKHKLPAPPDPQQVKALMGNLGFPSAAFDSPFFVSSSSNITSGSNHQPAADDTKGDRFNSVVKQARRQHNVSGADGKPLSEKNLGPFIGKQKEQYVNAIWADLPCKKKKKAPDADDSALLDRRSNATVQFQRVILLITAGHQFVSAIYTFQWGDGGGIAFASNVLLLLFSVFFASKIPTSFMLHRAWLMYLLIIFICVILNISSLAVLNAVDFGPPKKSEMFAPDNTTLTDHKANSIDKAFADHNIRYDPRGAVGSTYHLGLYDRDGSESVTCLQPLTCNAIDSWKFLFNALQTATLAWCLYLLNKTLTCYADCVIVLRSTAADVVAIEASPILKKRLNQMSTAQRKGKGDSETTPARSQQDINLLQNDSSGKQQTDR